MKITGFETIPIQGRAMVLKMFTDAGIIGYGEPMVFQDGFIELPTAPGLSVDMDDAASQCLPKPKDLGLLRVHQTIGVVWRSLSPRLVLCLCFSLHRGR